MNRRTSLITLFGFGLIGTSAFSIFKWVNNPVELEFIYSQKSLISELAETIIPRTDTPGAKDAKVGEFIIKIIVECTDQKHQSEFLTGLINLQEYAIKTYGKSFQRCTSQNKIRILEYYENKRFKSRILQKMETVLFGIPFIDKLKELTVIGFCTSEIGATKVLAYDFIPNYYLGCVALSPGQPSWATK